MRTWKPIWRLRKMQIRRLGKPANYDSSLQLCLTILLSSTSQGGDRKDVFFCKAGDQHYIPRTVKAADFKWADKD
ncbi:hypothetical protein QQ045_005913 [Rhodiola kirilowii]